MPATTPAAAAAADITVWHMMGDETSRIADFAAETIRMREANGLPKAIAMDCRTFEVDYLGDVEQINADRGPLGLVMVCYPIVIGSFKPLFQRKLEQDQVMAFPQGWRIAHDGSVKGFARGLRRLIEARLHPCDSTFKHQRDGTFTVAVCCAAYEECPHRRAFMHVAQSYIDALAKLRASTPGKAEEAHEPHAARCSDAGRAACAGCKKAMVPGVVLRQEIARHPDHVARLNADGQCNAIHLAVVQQLPFSAGATVDDANFSQCDRKAAEVDHLQAQQQPRGHFDDEPRPQPDAIPAQCPPRVQQAEHSTQHSDCQRAPAEHVLGVHVNFPATL